VRRVILIPSRYNSSRLFGKALLPLLGIPLVVHTYRRAEKSKLKNEIYLCTDSNKIIDVCKKYNLNYLKTSSKPKSGTDRIAEAAKKLNLKKNDLVIDVQGDEPLINPNNIDKTINFFIKNKFDIVVPHFKIKKKTSINICKLIVSKHNVKWITRKNLPHVMSGNKAPEYNKHFSVIVFTYDALKKFSKFKQTYHEKFESIELLRALENNMNLGTFALKGDSFSVDIKDDYTKAIRYLKKDKFIKSYL